MFVRRPSDFPLVIDCLLRKMQSCRSYNWTSIAQVGCPNFSGLQSDTSQHFLFKNGTCPCRCACIISCSKGIREQHSSKLYDLSQMIQYVSWRENHLCLCSSTRFNVSRLKNLSKINKKFGYCWFHIYGVLPQNVVFCHSKRDKYREHSRNFRC